jgi:hypothetical protein
LTKFVSFCQAHAVGLGFVDEKINKRILAKAAKILVMVWLVTKVRDITRTKVFNPSKTPKK